MKCLALILSVVLTIMFSMPAFAASSPTLADYIIAYEQEIQSKGEIGDEFNAWKRLYSTAIEIGEEQLVGTRTVQAVVQMTVGTTTNYRENFENMKNNKFLQALSKGDDYDYGLEAVMYLAKAYAKSDGKVTNDRGTVGGVFTSKNSSISWRFINHSALAQALGVTTTLTMAWEDALEAYLDRRVYYYTSNTP